MGGSPPPRSPPPCASSGSTSSSPPRCPGTKKRPDPGSGTPRGGRTDNVQLLLLYASKSSCRNNRGFNGRLRRGARSGGRCGGGRRAHGKPLLYDLQAALRMLEGGAGRFHSRCSLVLLTGLLISSLFQQHVAEEAAGLGSSTAGDTAPEGS